MINIKHFDSNLLKIEQSQKNIGIYYIRYITIKKIDDYENDYSVNLLYLIIGKVHGLLKKEMEVNIQFLILSTNENKEVLKNTQNFKMGLKMRLKQ